MHVPGEHVAFRGRGGLVPKHEGRGDMGAVHDGETQVRRWVARMTIMVAAHEQQIDRVVRRAPVRYGSKRRWNPPAARVKEIAEEHQPFRPGAGERRGKACE